jgi:O-acetyl-ADP-ribose deacetylase (regulator of RNase III)
MDEGLAREFEIRFPAECNMYKAQCAGQKYTVGDIQCVPYLGKSPGTNHSKWIIFFPTCVEPGSNSSRLILLMGLNNMVPVLERAGIRSVAVPALGVGQGLEWKTTVELVSKILGPVSWLKVEIHTQKNS